MKSRKFLFIGLGILALFVIFTVLVCTVDIGYAKAINLENGARELINVKVGLQSMNVAFSNAVGANKTLHKITNVLGYISFVPLVAFGLIGLIQWIKRKSIIKVDAHILVLGVYYLIILALFFIFDFGVIKINRRPVLMANETMPEWSYPSSSTLLALTIFPTMFIELKYFIKDKIAYWGLCAIGAMMMIAIVIGRLICGVHWLSDIMGAAILAAALFFLYYHFQKKFTYLTETKEN